MDSTSSGSSTASPTGAVRTRNKSAGSIAKRACDQCKFRKIKVCPSPHLPTRTREKKKPPRWPPPMLASPPR